MPWKNVTTKAARLDRSLKILIGMSGYFASFFSASTNSPLIAAPTTRRTTTFGLLHANTTPPKFRPRRSMTVMPRIARLPAQSIALRPAIAGVRGLCTSKKNSNSKKVRPQIGRFNQKIKRHENLEANKPPNNGPEPPAMHHIISSRP